MVYEVWGNFLVMKAGQVYCPGGPDVWVLSAKILFIPELLEYQCILGLSVFNHVSCVELR